MKKNQSHITHIFLPRNHKAKHPNIIYYVYIVDHEIISYKTLLQELLIQYTIVSHCHTKIGISMHQFTASWQPASITQSLLITIPEWIWSCLALTVQSSLEPPMCVLVASVQPLMSQLIVKMSISPISQLGLHWIWHACS